MIDRAAWPAAVQAAYDVGYRFLDLLTAVDQDPDGFEVLLRVWDVEGRRERLLRTSCPRDDARVPTVVPTYPGAAWHERAVAELFGIVFEGHDTAHLVLPESFEGHPLRKDFVLASRVAKRWPGAKDPGESDADLGTARRRQQPHGRPAGWGG